MHCTEKACDTTLNNEKYEVHRDRESPIGKHMTDGTQETHVVTALCDQPEAFASDLGDDQLPYLLTVSLQVTLVRNQTPTTFASL